MTDRIAQEKRVVEVMIRLYCRHKEGNPSLCPRCAALLAYANERLSRCCFGVEKPTCRRCPVHCYAPERREHIRQVMRWVGPRMLWYHPMLALQHLWAEKISTPAIFRKLAKEGR